MKFTTLQTSFTDDHISYIHVYVKCIEKETFDNMHFEFFADMTSSVLLMLFSRFSNKESDIGRKSKTYFVRIILGLIMSIAAFTAVCLIYKETFINYKAAIGLFSMIIIHLVWITLSELITNCVDWDIDIEDDNINKYIILSAANKLRDIVFDIYLLFYSLILSEWEMTYFSITIIVLFVSDILCNFTLILITVYMKFEGRDEEEENKLFLLAFFFFCPIFTPLYSCLATVDE